MPIAVQAVFAAALGAVLAAAPACAQTFRGKTIAILIGPGTAGSGYDLYGRMVARHLGRHLPGEPAVVARNMSGGAGLLLANHLQSAAPRDGTEIGMIADIAPLTELLGAPGVRYRSAEFNWIGRADASPGVIMTWQSSPVKTLDDAMHRHATIAVGPVGGLAHQMPALMNALFDTKLDLVQGYVSTAAMQQAMAQGETDGAFGDYGALRTSHPDWLENRAINLLVQFGVNRAPDLQDVLAAGELARDGAERALLALALSPSDIGRPFVTPPGTPADIVAMLRAGFDATLADPQLIAEAARARLALNPLSGDRLQARVVALAQTPADVVARAREVLAPR